MKILPSDNSYRTFCELTSGYRMFCVVAEAVRLGIIDRLEEGSATSLELLAATNLQPEEGERFIALLVSTGLLEQCDGLLHLSLFSRTFLSRSSATSQRQVLVFEPLLMENWHRLGTVLHEGQGALIREHPPDECRERLQLFQQAMTEAAVVRSRELWDAVTRLPESGTIIDIGAGEGTYLREFLGRNPLWQGIACDLADVCSRAASGCIPDNLSYYPCNIIDLEELSAFVSGYRAKADILLFSNICHCYSAAENAALLEQATALLADDGLLIVHDFYRDANSFGALYDLHMLVNTWNGRSYSIDEIKDMLQKAGLRHNTVFELPSFSLALVASRRTPYQAASLALKTSSTIDNGL
ncbi:acetylserotonin O-methyltransferase [Geobacter sp. OR-1]|uniref:methyltransferase n=1 Tax=Geobacter sp. OR-1 TaxID=1266765 RepID=UPI0005426123|nr:methyltransferase [Geobacter sp. OR-1]GAM08756.1 acetylserotonin O-methyltransferase [Geobacter sp. OR-1]